MENELTPSVLQRGNYHHHPADGDEPEDWEWFDADVICDDCIDVVIVRAAEFDAQAAEIAALRAERDALKQDALRAATAAFGTLACIEGRCMSARLGGYVLLALGLALLFVATEADKLL